jgi:hypothetical protein
MGFMRCENGHDNPPDMAFCGQCGLKLDVGLPEHSLPPKHSSMQPAPGQEAPGQAGQNLPPAFEPTAISASPPLKTSEAAPRSKMPWVFAAIFIGVVAIVTGIVAFNQRTGGEMPADARSAQSNSQHPIQEAAEGCGVEDNVGDNGSTITLDTEGEEDYSGDDDTEVACVLMALETPDRVISRIDQTRAIDGTLDASWGDYEAFWNYHPDSGMNLTLYETE